MIGCARDWLPVEAAATEAVRAMLEACVAEWSNKWVKEGRFELLGLELAKEPDSAFHHGWQFPGGPVGVAMEDEASRLAALPIGAKPGTLNFSKTDLRIVQDFGRMLMADLVAIVEGSLPAASTAGAPSTSILDVFEGGGGVLVDVGTPGSPMLKLAIPMWALAQLCKSSVGQSSRSKEGMGTLVKALGETRLAVTCSVGQASVPLGDLAELSCGDVLILDRTVEEGALLAVTDSDGALARGALSEAGGAISIVIQA